MKENLLELFQAADQLSVSVSTIKRYIKRGQIDAYNMSAGGKYNVYKVSQESVDKFRNARRINNNVIY